MILDEEFIHEFDLFFNADLIDVKDKAAILHEARVLGEVVSGWEKKQEIKQQLSLVRKSMDPQAIRQITNATHVDWTFNTATLDLLREILLTTEGTIKTE